MVNLFSCLVFMLIIAQPAAVRAGNDAFYHVVSGDNLSFIAKRFGIALKDLRQANNLSSDRLAINQKLAVPHPFKKSAKDKVQWKKPCSQVGGVLRPFGQYKANNILMARTGQDRSCPVGSPVYSPAIAVVKYIGLLDGFGTIMILQHKGSYATVFSPMNPQSLAVGQGQAINAGQLLGRTGQPVLEDSAPYIHLELRKNEIAIEPDPLHP